MKNLVIFQTSVVLLLAIGTWCQVPYANFEIVETIPVETNLDNPNIRDTLPVWLEMIGNAKKNLDIEQMYVASKPGEPLEKIVDAIVKAAIRGVKVRIIASKQFYKIYPKTLDILDKKENIEVRLLNMTLLQGAGIQHAKFFIVDREQVFIGSQNFDWRALKHNQELGVRIHHKEMASALLDIFEIDWKLCVINKKKKTKIVPHRKYPQFFSIFEKGQPPIKFHPVWSPKFLSPNRNLWTLRKILTGIKKAKEHININLLTYSPITRNNAYWYRLDVSLRIAAVRGVKVRMLVADWNKRHPNIDHLKSLTLVPNIEIKFSTIPQHSSGFIPYARVTHAKFMTIDRNWSWIGCSNWSKGYFYNTRDVGVIVQSTKFTQHIIQIFEKLWNSKYTYLIQAQVKYVQPKIGYE